MPRYNITYTDNIYADNLEEARKRLFEVLASDVEHRDVDAFEITEVKDD